MPDLVERAQGGDVAALEEVIAVLARELLPVASALAGPDGGPELLGDALSRAYERLDQVRSPDALLGWARTLLVRLYIDGRRRRARLVRLDTIRVAVPAPDPRDLDVRRALARLPRDRRALVVLHYWLGFTLPQTASILGIREGTAKSRLHATLTQLRRDLA